MTVNRPRSLSRQNTPHSLILPYDNINNCSTTSLTTASGVSDISSYLPSTDESLQDWLARNIPEANSPSPLSSLMNETCPCCEKYDCENMEPLYKTIKKLESDACLAAQIGQSLLQKHESLIIETNKTKNGLEQQLSECREKVINLEMLLEDADNSKQETEEEKDRSYCKWQKAQKALEETSIDLGKANQRCIDIGHELQNKTKELEKLRIFKFMVRQADFREDMLRSQLEDINQELATSRKNELMLESKYKKLKSRYETVCTTCEKLRMDGGQTLDNNRQMDYLLESNEQLQNDIIKLTSMMSDPSPSTEQDYLITLIKELTLANTKLKMELLDGNLLSFDQHLYDNQESTNNSPTSELDENQLLATTTTTTTAATVAAMDGPDDILTASPTNSLLIGKELEDDTMAERRSIEVNENSVLTKAPSPTTSSSLPTLSSLPTSSKHSTIHYHYHYNSHKAKRPLAAIFRRSYNVISKGQQVTSNLDAASTSPTSTEIESTTDDVNHTNPYGQLEKNASLVFDRLKSTDIRSLNRRLKRAFDIMELSSMSNSIINNILSDILLLQGQFPWVAVMDDDINNKNNNNDTQHQALSSFFPTLTLLQNMLTEIGELRMTMNDLQLEYVKKVEEMGQLAEQDVLRKRQEAALQASNQQQKSDNSNNGGRAALEWLSNVFHLSTNQKTVTSTTTTTTVSSTDAMHQQRCIRYQRSFDSMFTATTATRDTIYNNKPLATTTSSGLRIKQKKHDFDCFGPSSSLPRSNSMNEQKRQRRTGSSQPSNNNNNNKHYAQSLRPSISAGGPVRKSVASPGVWSSSAPPPAVSHLPPQATPPSLSPLTCNDIKTVQRKRSLLGLGGGGIKDPSDKLDGSVSGSVSSSDWNLGTSFGGSWLGT